MKSKLGFEPEAIEVHPSDVGVIGAAQNGDKLNQFIERRVRIAIENIEFRTRSEHMEFARCDVGTALIRQVDPAFSIRQLRGIASATKRGIIGQPHCDISNSKSMSNLQQSVTSGMWIKGHTCVVKGFSRLTVGFPQKPLCR